jgi:glycerol kinase
MDAIPIRLLTTHGEVFKDATEPQTQSRHVEHAKLVVTDSHEHLPRGVLETEEEKKSHWFIGSIDCGTTSSRFLIFDGEGNPVASHQIEFDNLYPESG